MIDKQTNVKKLLKTNVKSSCKIHYKIPEKTKLHVPLNLSPEIFSEAL